jgi:MFS transporter, DHA2 family, glioxin efflux transporter
MQTIVATAIPKITDQFHSVSQIGWYGSAFLLTFGSFTSPWGKLFKYFTLKWTYLVAVFIFELGSLICGTCISRVDTHSDRLTAAFSRCPK